MSLFDDRPERPKKLRAPSIRLVFGEWVGNLELQPAFHRNHR
jgi:hypothetical protein